MSIVVKTKTIVCVLCVLFIGVFISGWGLGRKKGDSVNMEAIQALKDQIKHYVIRIGNDSVYISSKEQEILTQKEAIRQGEITREELRKLNLKQANEITRLKLRVDTLLEDVSHNGTIITVHDTITLKPNNCMLLPFSFSKKDPWLNLTGSFNSQGILDISIKMDMFIDLWAGIDKKTKKPTAVLTSKNPYINTLSISSIKLDMPKKKYYGIGVCAGYGLDLKTTKLSPYLGIGLQYSFIRF